MNRNFMTEFFYNHECGTTLSGNTILKHHFNFGTHYVPTKFGRSTLRRADYITITDAYMSSAQRNHILLLYPLHHQSIQLTLNDTVYSLQPDMLSAFLLPIETSIILTNICDTNLPNHILLFECDTHIIPEIAAPYTIAENTDETTIHITAFNGLYDFNPQAKPFFGFVLNGTLTTDKTELNACDGFYTTKPIETMGNAKILSFSMPLPL